ncbi:MAG: helix-turn-helix domain-containing protein [Oligoflexales bacterium]
MNPLLQIYNQRRSVNRRYSLRAFARDLGLSRSTVSDLVRGKRPLSVAALEKIENKNRLSVAELRQIAVVRAQQSFASFPSIEECKLLDGRQYLVKRKTVKLDPEKIEELVAEIMRFHRDLARFESSEDDSIAHVVELKFFPCTDEGEKY